MKTTQILIALVSAGAIMMGGEVGSLTTFKANTTAKASEVNGNFEAVKKAVDDNAGDIAVNANNIATNTNDIQTNQTNIQKAVTGITVGKGLKGGGNGGDINVTLADGYVVVGSPDFVTTHSYCKLVHTEEDIYFDASGTTYHGCDAYASVHLPYGATPVALACRVHHEYPQGDVDISLVKMYGIDNAHLNAVVPISLTFDTFSGAEMQYQKTANPVFTLPWKDDYSYSNLYLVYSPPHTKTAGNKESLYDCAVYYVY